VRAIEPREFSLIRRFVAVFDPPAPPRGPGDDCAVLPGSRWDTCVTVDALVEGVHFTRRHFRFEDIGHKALAVNLSDLAAMGARPRWFLCALAIPKQLGTGPVMAMARGMSALARKHRMALVGGNVSKAAQLSITITAAGTVRRGRALTRQGARSGDRLFVSGTLGDARLALSLWRRGQRTTAAARQVRPTPRVELGQLSIPYARAAIDLSDGLAQDLAQMCRASRLGAQVDIERLPVSAELRRRAGSARRAAKWALAGGEDYELLIAVPPNRCAAFERACARSGEQVREVGVITRTPSVVFSFGGHAIPAPLGYDHLA
jgi:thiamine-monophosphate kinase